MQPSVPFIRNRLVEDVRFLVLFAHLADNECQEDTDHSRGDEEDEDAGVAGIALLVEEAGGKSTHIDGSPMQFVDAEQVVFSNKILHEVLVNTVS